MKKYQFLTLFLFIPFCIQLIANTNDSIILTINDNQITKSEFLRIYNKNNENVYDSKTIDEYMELFINFKLKVIEAESLGLDTTKKFLDEFGGYKKQLEEPYLALKNIDDVLVEEAYSRYKEEINASHILVKCGLDDTPEDTLSAYNKALEIRQRLFRGEKFDALAKATSDDPSAKENGGYIGYFTVFQLVYPFESAAFKLQKGEISMPVRTKFGYHIIKINERRPARGEIKVAHIMVSIPKDASEDSIKNARKRIETIQQKLKAGEDFGELAKLYTDDKRSKLKGGELHYFGIGRMIPEFEEAAFALNNIGDISGIVKTNIGFHIIKLVDRQGIRSLEEMKDFILKKIDKDTRSKRKDDAYINHLKTEYNFIEYNESKTELFTAIDTNLYYDKLVLDENTYSKPLFQFDTLVFTQIDFFNELKTNAKTANKKLPVPVYLDRQYSKFVSKSLKNFERTQLSKKYPEFRYLLEEYHDGILLFELTDSMVWSKAVKDSVGLNNFYEQNKNNYMWGERVLATFYTCNDSITALQTKSLIDKYIKKNKAVYANEIFRKINKDSLLLTTDTKKYSKGQDFIIDSLSWDPGFSNIIYSSDKPVIVQIIEKVPPEPKSLNEAKGLIIADYQTFLEEKWIADLRKKYKIEINEEVLSSIKK